MTIYNHRFGPVQQPGFRAVITRAHRRTLGVARGVAAVALAVLLLVLIAAGRS